MIKIYTRENCSNCKTVKELLTSLGYEYTEINADENRDEVNLYAPKENWNLPLITYWQGNDLVNVTTGIVDKETIELPQHELETLQAMAYRSAKELYAFEQALKKLQHKAQMLEKIIGYKELIKAEAKPVNNIVPTIEDPADANQLDCCQ